MARAATAPKLAIPTLPSVRIERFFGRQLIHGKGEFAGRPFLLEDWQRRDIQGIYDPLVLERGAMVRQVREALIGVAKKNGKTHIGAGLGAVGLYADGYYRKEGGGWLWTPEYGAEVYNVAGSRQQAKVLFEIASGFVQRSPQLRAMSRIYKDAIEVPETESVWRVLAADAKLAHGPNPSKVIIDEIWVHRDPELYEAFASAGAARRQPLLLIITTAGFDQDSIAFKLYERGLRRRSRKFYVHWYQAPDGCSLEDFKGFRKANPSKWINVAYLKGELSRARRLGLENQYRRFHGNQWTSSREQAIPLDLWDSGAGKAKIPKDAPSKSIVIGVDSAPKRDSTGIVLVYKDPAGVHHWRHRKMVADPDTGYLDYDALEELIRQLYRLHQPDRILVDPYNMIRSMVLLAEEGLPIEEFPQGDVRMVPASMNLYELLTQGRLRHGGDPELRRQVQSAVKKITERGWRLKKMGSGVIDGLIAGTMASYELERAPDEEEPQPSLFV